MYNHLLDNVVDIPVSASRAVFTNYKESAEVFRDDSESPLDTLPGGDIQYYRWGGNNLMPNEILEKIEKDETVSSCLKFNAEVLAGAGITYVPKRDEDADDAIEAEIDDFFVDSSMQSYHLGMCLDLKYFMFAVTVIILSKNRKRIARIVRKHACYCRFAVNDKKQITSVISGLWSNGINADNAEILPLLDMHAPLADLRERMAKPHCPAKFAIVTRIPTADNLVYPIPNYGALFRGKWYDIKQLIGLAKLTKLRNSAPIRYHIEVSDKYWDRLFARENLVDPVKQRERLAKERNNIIKFLTGLENSGKVWFSEFYTNPRGEVDHDIVINKIDTEKEGGDWASDLQEAVNMICFTLGVHSNLVGSVPGKSQSNNSGSDKRELYTIAQAQQSAYRQILYNIHNLVIAINGWRKYKPVCPFVQLTTLDEHSDAKTSTINDTAPRT